MIIVFKPKTKEEEVQKIVKQVEDKGLSTHLVVGEDVTICGIIGDTTKVDPRQDVYKRQDQTLFYWKNR